MRPPAVDSVLLYRLFACRCLLGGWLLAIAVAGVARGQEVQATRASSEAGGTAVAEEPSEIVWSTDEEGRQYRVEALDKTIPSQRLEGDRLATPWGAVVQLEGEDEDFFYFRLYRQPDGPRAPAREELLRKPVPEGADPSSLIPWDGLPTVHSLEVEPLSGGLPPPAQWRNGLRLADLDGDGRLDLVLPPARKRFGGPVVRLGAQEAWKPWPELQWASAPWDYGDVEVADFDGDGRLDLAFAMHLKGLLVLVQRPEGRFERWSEGLGLADKKTESRPFSGRALTSADVDGDGRIDLLVLGEGPRINLERPDPGSFGLRFLRNAGKGLWEDRGAVPGSESIFGQSLSRGDLDGDGILEILAGSEKAGVSGLLVSLTPEGPIVREAPLAPGSNAVAWAVALGKASPELVAVTSAYTGEGWRSALEVFEPRGSERWGRQTVLRLEGAFQLTALALVDVEGDSQNELAVGTADGRVVLLRRRDGKWLREAQDLLSPVPGCRVYGMVAASSEPGVALLAASRAGEGGSGPFPGMATGGCSAGGDVHVWRLSQLIEP